MMKRKLQNIIQWTEEWTSKNRHVQSRFCLFFFLSQVNYMNYLLAEVFVNRFNRITQYVMLVHCFIVEPKDKHASFSYFSLRILIKKQKLKLVLVSEWRNIHVRTVTTRQQQQQCSVVPVPIEQCQRNYRVDCVHIWIENSDSVCFQLIQTIRQSIHQNIEQKKKKKKKTRSKHMKIDCFVSP